MNILVLTEGGRKTGFGHISRCCALTQVISSFNKTRARFVVNGDRSAEDFLKQQNAKSIIMLDWIKKKNRVKNLIKGSDMVIIDSYLAPKGLYDFIYHLVDSSRARLLCIDDYNRINYPPAKILNPSIYGHLLKHDNNTYLTGRDYVMLRKEFWNIPKKKIREKVKDVLIVFGGITRGNFIKRFIGFMSKRYPDFNYHLVLPDSNLSTRDIVKLMLKCDICISAGGQTLYELARTGLPTIGICFAENQRLNLEAWRDKGFIKYIGWHRDKSMFNRLGRAVEKLLPYRERVKHCRIGKNVIPGISKRNIYNTLAKKDKKNNRYIIATIKSWNIKESRKFIAKNPSLNIKLITDKHKLTYESIKKFNPRHIFLPHWSWIIPEDIYKNFECIVFHMTDLPFGRGGSPLQNLIEREKCRTKLTAIRVTKGLDAGPVYLKRDLNLNGSAADIYKRSSRDVFRAMIPYIIKKKPCPAPQKGKAIKFKRRTVDQSDISGLKSKKKIYDYIRMLDAEGYPLAFLENPGFKVEFSDAKIKKEYVLAKARIKVK